MWSSRRTTAAGRSHALPRSHRTAERARYRDGKQESGVCDNGEANRRCDAGGALLFARTRQQRATAGVAPTSPCGPPAAPHPTTVGTNASCGNGPEAPFEDVVRSFVHQAFRASVADQLVPDRRSSRCRQRRAALTRGDRDRRSLARGDQRAAALVASITSTPRDIPLTIDYARGKLSPAAACPAGTRSSPRRARDLRE
jgi:hypothetical protein